MIECCAENIYYKKRRFKFRFKRFLMLITVIILMILYYNFFIIKQVFNVCVDFSYSYSAEAVNTAIIQTSELFGKYNDLITVEKNANGDIVYISTNSTKINSISRAVVQKTNSLLAEKLKKGVPVPLLAFTGISFVSGYGAKINYKTINVSSVTCDLISEFCSVGINQTLHSIYLEVNSIVSVGNLYLKKEIQCPTKVLINEAVLVGKVPEIYLNGGLKYS